MSDNAATAINNASRLVLDNKLPARSMQVGVTTEDLSVVEISVGEDPRAVLEWARFLDAETVGVERRPFRSNLTVVGTKDGNTWAVSGWFPKRDTDSRSRYPGITINWARREIGGAQSGKGTITPGQLEVLIGALGV